VHQDPVTGFIPYHCRALGSKWTTLPSALLLVCDSVLQSCDHTYVYVELRSQSMVIMDYLVAPAQDDIHATIKSTRYCVVHLTPPVLMQLESHIRSMVVMTRDQMEQLRFRERGAIVLPGTPPAPKQTHSHMC